MYKRATYTLFASLVVGIFFALPIPLHAYALGLYVPVNDDSVGESVDNVGNRVKDLNAAFATYVKDFKNIIHDDEGKSLRALLSLNPPLGEASQLYLSGKNNYVTGGKAKDPVDRTDAQSIKDTANRACALRPITNSARAMPLGSGSAWSELVKKGILNPQNQDYSGTQVNDSTSLSCLLQELVEQNKLDLNLKIHSILRDYISNAQATQLAQRASGMIAKANVDWAKTGVKNKIYDEDGNLISEEDYSVLGNDPNAYENSLTQARARTLQSRILAKNDAPDSLQVCGTAKYDVARKLLTEANKQTVDPLDALSSQVSCSLTDKTNPSAGLFATEDGYKQFISPEGGGGQQDTLETFAALINNDQNTGHGLELALENAQGSQINKIRNNAQTEYIAGGGVLPARQCDPNDKNCDPRFSEISTPGRIVGDVVSGYVRAPDEKLASAKTAEDISSVDTSVNDSPSENILRNGLDNADSNRFIPAQNTAKYIGDFLNSIQYGYFDLQAGTTDWAAGAMLKIYDNSVLDPSMYQNKNTLDPADTAGDVATSSPLVP